MKRLNASNPTGKKNSLYRQHKEFWKTVQSGAAAGPHSSATAAQEQEFSMDIHQQSNEETEQGGTHGRIMTRADIDADSGSEMTVMGEGNEAVMRPADPSTAGCFVTEFFRGLCIGLITLIKN
jgi:hypothetical protein